MNINKNMSKSDIQECIDNFNKDFKVKVENDNPTLLIDLFENFVNLSMSAAKNEKLDKIVELEEKINATFNERDKKLFEQWNELQDKFVGNEVQQAFMYGICIYKRLSEETNISGGKK